MRKSQLNDSHYVAIDYQNLVRLIIKRDHDSDSALTKCYVCVHKDSPVIAIYTLMLLDTKEILPETKILKTFKNKSLIRVELPFSFDTFEIINSIKEYVKSEESDQPMILNIPTAVNHITTALSNDPGLKESYKANIAMAFKDEYHSFKQKFPKKYINMTIMHEIANAAADNFLNSWIKNALD